MRLPRPYVPLRVRVLVAERQVRERDGFVYRPKTCRHSDKMWLDILLGILFGDQKVELHHRPALCNRKLVRHWIKGKGETIIYDPPANDPDYLVYMPADEHDIETRVRGQHGQHSDLALARKAKRIAKKRDPKRRKYKWPKRSFAKRVKDKP